MILKDKEDSTSSFFVEFVRTVFFPKLLKDSDTQTRAWLMFWTCVVSGGALFLILLLAGSLGFQGTPFTFIALGHSCVIVCVFSLRFSTTMTYPSLSIGIISTLQLIQATYWSGGVNSSVVYAYPILPVFLVYISGIRVAMMSGLLLFSGLIAFAMVDIDPISIHPLIKLLILFWVLFTGVFIAGFAHYREKQSRKEIIAQVEKQEIMEERIQMLIEEQTLFWSNISHELRNNITILYSFSELLQLENPRGKQKKYIENMLNTCTHIQYLLDQTMLLAQLDSNNLRLEKQQFSLNALLLALQQKFSIHAKNRNLDLIMEIETTSDSLFTDEYRLGQVLNNLLSNAIKFTNSGSVSLRVHEQKDVFVFSIIDTGVGIPHNDIQNIFEPYFRRNNRRTQGMGLGLSIVKKILSLFDSELVVESNLAQGSTFTFEIPKSK